ncbi:hypothetical protein EMCRGX_G021989 [Ephydatia muelleri]
MSQKGKIVKFTSNTCYILDKRHKMIAKAAKMEKLYKLKCKTIHEHAGIATISKDVWHKQFRQLGVGSLQRLSRDRLADGFDYDVSQQLTFWLKQSPRCWNQVLDAQLKKMDLQQSTSDPCIYTSNNSRAQVIHYLTSKDGLFIIAIYVDDILLAAKSEKRIAQVKCDLAKHFQLKDMAEFHYFLGVNVKQNSETGKIWIEQPGYTEAMLKKFGMENYKPA